MTPVDLTLSTLWSTPLGVSVRSVQNGSLPLTIARYRYLRPWSLSGTLSDASGLDEPSLRWA